MYSLAPHFVVFSYLDAKKLYDAVVKKEKAAVAAVKAAETALAQAEATLATMALDTKAPFMDAFLDFFKEYYIQRLAYFGGSLQGEHINTIFSSTTAIKAMTSILKAREIEVAPGRSILIGSDTLAKDYERLGVSFGRLHCLYNRKAPLCKHERDAYPGWISEFAIAFAEVLPDVKPTPKLHVITHHHMDILQLKGSVGFETEQGMEGYHCECNAVERNTGNTKDQHKKVALTMQRTWERAASSDFQHAKHERAERAREKKRQKRGDASGFYACEVRVDPE